MVKKKNGQSRFCVDYRKLNKLTIKDSFPIPHVDDTLLALDGSMYFSLFDLVSGYWQVKVDEESVEKTDFVTSSGLFEFLVMPFGLTNAPATFQRIMNKILKGLSLKQCVVYLDDIIVFSRFELTKNGYKPDPNKTQAIVKMDHPIDANQLRRFLGSINFYRRFIASFSQIAAPLYRLLGKNIKFVWNKVCNEAFDELKNKLISAPILDDVYKPIAFASRRLTQTEKNYTTSEKEATAAVWSLRNFNDFTYGREVELFTDHEPLSTFKSIKDTSSRQNNLMMKIQEISPDVLIRYKPGHLNVEADMLSRANINQITLNSTINWSIEQDKDDNLTQLKSLLISNDKSLTDFWSSSCDNFKKSVILMKDKIMLENGVIKFKAESNLIFLPEHKFSNILISFHDDPLNGRLSYEKTLKPNLKLIISKFPFEIVGIDVVGPLPTTSREMKYIIVAICYYSKWCEALAVKDFTVLTTAIFIINQIIFKYGFMHKIVSDQGRNFESDLIKELCNSLKIEKLRTTAYHPQCNGEVERQNRTLKSILSKYVNCNHTNWDLFLNTTLFAYNTAFNSRTGKSPYEILFGRVENGLNDVKFATDISKSW
ncbi:unnamed protein product [Brachionus calyciflorus]|uniref:Uncharacterized protein n=1 Tax=Brachionus calyciflorus TaxID=104777 RepID=A0A814JMK3_9BILA|nr:unnamed protein product [Brachionus calyciflorus]